MPEKPCIVVTRPIEDAMETCGVLKNHGFDCFIEPIFSIQNLPQSMPATELLQNSTIVVTSRNAVRALTGLTHTNSRNMCIIVLGKATAIFAEMQGFTDTRYAGENVAALCEYIKLHYAGRHLVYASGKTISRDLTWENCGAIIKRIILYEAIPATGFSGEFRERLLSGNFKAVMFLSNSSAAIFCNLLKKDELQVYSKNLYAFCFSANIAEDVANCCFKDTVWPENPDMDAMIRLLANFQFA